MHPEAGETGHDVFDRLLCTAIQREPVQADPESLGREPRERLAGVYGGQGEAVPKQSREPRLGQVCGRADVLESLTHWRHVRERLIDVEHEQNWAPEAARTVRIVRASEDRLGTSVCHHFTIPTDSPTFTIWLAAPDWPPAHSPRLF